MVQTLRYANFSVSCQLALSPSRHEISTLSPTCVRQSDLHQLPVDALKIDRSFVIDMDASRRNSDIVETIITLSNRLGLVAVAEGVETQCQLEHLHKLGCELAQGYWFARPLPTEAAEALLAAASGGTLYSKKPKKGHETCG